ncbi:MAG: hypothetical protein H7232_14400 [Aeromicrobium sp.]|nr:hypothetical protein [Burkholderiales bacterium]
MQFNFKTSPSRVAVNACLAAALISTTVMTAGVAALFSARPVTTGALPSADHLPLVVTATRLKADGATMPPQTHQTQSVSLRCTAIVC